MAWINSAFTIDDAIARRFATWDLLISGWGYQPNPSAASPKYNTAFPAPGERGLPSILGVAIGDQSEVDRCFVTYDIEKIIPSQVLWDVAHRLSVPSPLMFPQAGQREVVQPGPGGIDPNPATGAASIVVYPTGTFGISNGGMSPTLIGPQYKTAAGTLATFPSANAPLLHLVFYLKPPVVGPPTRRTPYTHSGSVANTSATGLVFAAPTFGRRTVIVNFSTNENSSFTYDIRISAITNISAAATEGEVDLHSETGISSTESRRVLITPANADYIMVYAVPSGTAQNRVSALVSATDD